MISPSRRQFLQATAAAGALTALSSPLAGAARAQDESTAIAYGLVTYMWGADWDLKSLLENLPEDGRPGGGAAYHSRPQGGAQPVGR
jgi:hypothetical protein